MCTLNLITFVDHNYMHKHALSMNCLQLVATANNMEFNAIYRTSLQNFIINE